MANERCSCAPSISILCLWIRKRSVSASTFRATKKMIETLRCLSLKKTSKVETKQMYSYEIIYQGKRWFLENRRKQSVRSKSARGTQMRRCILCKRSNLQDRLRQLLLRSGLCAHFVIIFFIIIITTSMKQHNKAQSSIRCLRLLFNGPSGAISNDRSLEIHQYRAHFLGWNPWGYLREVPFTLPALPIMPYSPYWSRRPIS